METLRFQSFMMNVVGGVAGIVFVYTLLAPSVTSIIQFVDAITIAA